MSNDVMPDTSTEVAAWVGERAIGVALIEERLAVLRAGPHAGRLPQPGTAEWRNLRRWLVQAITTEAVIEHEAAVRGIAAAAPDRSPRSLTLLDALRVGGVTAAIVATHPQACALRRHVAPDAVTADDETFGYYLRNRDRHPEPYEQVRDQIAAELGTVSRDRRFAQWLDERYADLVRLQPGFEHPGDPRHPDATHRH
jgi:[acyl-carrier-protein] S-malonyltransferase